MNKFERTKAEKDGLDVLPALLRAADEGWETLDDGDLMRLKWYGLYAHNAKDGHFMLRVKVVQGVLSADQAEVMASIAEDFGRGIIDCTTRQCFQVHWITLDDVREIFARLDGCGLTTSGACGDITRNVVGCTVASIAHDQVVDGHAVAEATHEHFLDNKLYSNLPRKYKISITGCREDCARGLINDVALSGAVHDDGTAGFNLRIGGGLSSSPHFARSLDVFVTPEEVPEVVAGVTAIFRDSEENRSKRGRARLKFLVDAMGPEAFREELVRRVGRELRPAAPARGGWGRDLGHDHLGDHAAGRRRAQRGRVLRPRRAPEGLAAPRARAPRPRVRHDAGGAADAPAERPAAVDPRTSGWTTSSPSPSRRSSSRGRRSSTARCRRAPARSSAAWPRCTRRARTGAAPPRSPRSSTRTSRRTATARTSGCTSPGAPRAAPSTRSRTSASRAS